MNAKHYLIIYVVTLQFSARATDKLHMKKKERKKEI